MRACGSKCHGFTLIELLTSVAIVIALAALAFSVGGKMMEKARFTQCQANLKDLGVALNLYRADHDMQYPKTWDGQYFWFNYLVQEGYLANAKDLYCPALGKGEAYVAMNLGVQSGYGMTYLSIWYPTPSNTDKDPYFLNRKLKQLSRWPLLMDADYPQVGNLDQPLENADRQKRFKARHNGLANVLMMDGHMELAKYGDTRWSQQNLNAPGMY